MSNRIIDINGAPATPEPPNVPVMIEAARTRWKLGEKHKGFETLCDAMQLVVMGIGRNMRDAQKIQAELKKIQEELKGLRERITPK